MIENKPRDSLFGIFTAICGCNLEIADSPKFNEKRRDGVRKLSCNLQDFSKLIFFTKKNTKIVEPNQGFVIIL